MEQTIEKILEDLYTIDPSFKEHEAKLRKLLAELLASRPNVSVDKEFAEGLRRQLMAKVSIQNNQPTTNLNIMKKLNFALAGALAIVLVLSGASYVNKNQKGKQATVSLLSGEVQVSEVGQEAFGSLNSFDTANTRNQSGGGGGGGTENPVSSSLAYGMGGDMGMSEKIMPPFPTNVKYTYNGETITLDQTQMEVFKRVKGLSASADVSSIISQLNLGVADISKFGNLKLEQLTLSEDKEFGYSIYISVPEGSVSIYSNWAKWPNPYLNCMDEACYNSLRLNPNDVPADSALISLSTKFLNDHGISTANYGQPFVNADWRVQYNLATDKSQAYIPDEVTVVYPFVFEGQEVYDQGGSRTGLMVNINVRQNRVSGINELTSQQYQSSTYTAETDVARILALAEQGGFFPNYYYYGYGMEGMAEGQQPPTVEVTLGTPKLAYLKMWQYKDNQSSELMVPSLIFPVTSSNEAYSSKNVIVPLIKEILDDPNNNPIRTMSSDPVMTLPAPDASPAVKPEPMAD